MKRLIQITVLAFVSGLTAAHAAETEKAKMPAASPAPSPQASPAATEATAPIELKKKSVFALEANARNPFWPIGWKPAAKIAEATTERVGPDLPPSAFLVTSITLQNGAHFAIVNGKIMKEGQQFGLQLGNQTYQVTLKRIEDGQVIIGKRDQEIVVPLRRK